MRTCRQCSKKLKHYQKKYCSIRCRVEKHSMISKTAKEVREARKEPKFVDNHLKWAYETYWYYRHKNLIPKSSSDEYGLYKYGEWLVKNYE